MAEDANSNIRLRKMVPNVTVTQGQANPVLELEILSSSPSPSGAPSGSNLRKSPPDSVASNESGYGGGTGDRSPLLEGEYDTDSSSQGGQGGTVIIKSVDDEPAWTIALQVCVPYLIAGFGMVAAGIVLDIVQHWPVFIEISEIFILVPALLGLKGNLEMTLASRLSTEANLGTMDRRSELIRMIAGNIFLTQGQALVVGFLASLFAMVLGWVPEGKFDLRHALILASSSIITASLASLILGIVMIVVVVFSRKCNINPDNVATPIAASLGDLITLTILAVVSSGLYYLAHHKLFFIAPILLAVLLLLIPFWIWLAHRNKYTRDVVYNGWTPIISAMLISSMGGLILDYTVANYYGIAVFQPVINGVGGNLVAVQASRLSTNLHKRSRPGVLPRGALVGCPNIVTTFLGRGVESRTARVLLGLVIPGQLIFMYTISGLEKGHTTVTFIFASFYLTAALLQVFILLFVANWMVHRMWAKGDNPDNCAIPYLTALGDLLGTGLLAIAFHLLYLIGDRDSDVGS